MAAIGDDPDFDRLVDEEVRRLNRLGAMKKADPAGWRRVVSHGAKNIDAIDAALDAEEGRQR